MMIFFMAALIVCGLYDYKFKEVPFWSILLLNVIGIGMYAMHHPVLSVLTAICAAGLCLIIRIGPADKMVFPIVAGVFQMEGIFLIGLVIVLSICYTQITSKAAPGISILTVISILAMIGGTFL